MPVYQITGKNGKVYQIEGPVGATRDQIIKAVLERAPEAGVPPQGESVIEGIPLVGGVLGQLADYPATFVEGLAGIGEGIAASAGAGTGLTEFLKDVASGAKSLRSEESRAEEKKRAIRSQLAEQRGVGAEVGAALRNFIESPFETTASVTGSAIPFIAAGALAPETGGASLLPVASMLGLGAIAGAGTVKSEIYDAVYEETKKAGASEEQARAAAERAQEYGGENLDQIALGSALGGAAAATGFAPAMARTIGSRASARVAQRIAQREAAEAAGTEIARKSVAAGAAKGVAMEAFPEAGQAAQERYARNVALQREGFDVDPWQGVAGAAAAEGLASIVLGGYGGARETQQENLSATVKQYAAKVEALPDDPTDEDAASIAAWAKSRGYDDAKAAAIAKDAVEKKTAIVAAKRAKEEADATEIKRFTDLGFDEETARTIVSNAQLQREAAARQAAEEERLRQEARDARTAGVEPSPEPDIGAPPPVDLEEQAAMDRLRAEEVGAPASPFVFDDYASEGLKDYGSYRALEAERQRVLQEQTKRSELLQDTGRLSAYAQSKGISDVEMRQLLTDNYKTGQDRLTRLTKFMLSPEVQQAALDESERAKRAQAGMTWVEVPEYTEVSEASVAPTPMAAPQRFGLTPDTAQTLIARIEQAPELQSEVEAETGLTLDDLYDIAEGTQAKYSRGRRPKDTATPDMFAGAPVQVAPGEALKRDEYNALRFASEEEKAAREQRFAEEMEAGMGRVAAMQQRAEEAKRAKLDELQQAIYTAHPSNRAYTVDYREGSRNPYRVLGPNGEVFVTEDNLDDFEESVGDLLPYSVESQETLAVGEVEKPGPEELSEPTVATRMIQEFVAEVDTARKAGQIDDSQRAELLRRLERPDAYKIVNGKEKPNDAIARNEVAARKAMERYNNAPAADKAAAEEALVTANQALASSVKNALLNPARAKMKSMAETRVASKREAKTRETAAQLQQRLGEGALERPTQVAEELQDAPERLAIAELKADLSEKTLSKAKRVLEKAQQRKKRDMLTERKLQDAIATAQKRLDVAEVQIGREVERSERLEAAKEEKERLERGVREERTKEREAKIDLAQQRVQKYRKAPSKGGTEASIVQRVVDKITSQWKSTNPVVVVQSISDIPDAKVRRAIQRDGAMDAEGLVAPDGTIYLIADNLDGEARAKAVLFHEGLGHVGLEKLFREKLDSVLNALYKGNAKLRAETDAWMKANPDAYKDDVDPLARAVEEVLAERSEAGRIEPSIFNRLAAIIRNFARRLGINLALSDADVDAILAAAHERTVNGPQESQLVKGMRYVGAAPEPKVSGKKTKKVVDAAAGLSAGRRRVDDTLSTYGMMDGIEEATKATPVLRDAIAFAEGTSSPVRRAALKSMPTSGITGWMQRKAPKVYEVAEVLVDTVRKMNGLRTNLMAAGDDIVRDMADFVRTHGSTTLARAQFTNRINEIDFLAFDTVDEALTKHRLVAAIEKQLISNSNNKAETRRLLNEIKEQAAKDSDNTSVLKDKVNLSTPLKAKANELSKLAVDADKVLLKVKQLAAVTQRIRDSYAVKAELAKQKGGLELYKAERQYHKDILEARQALLDERIERGLGKEQATRIRDMRARMMREMQSPNERQKAGDLFWDLDADLFDKEYFPMLRDGQYWLRVKEDLSKGREEQFYVFESARELTQARRKLAAQLKEDAESSAVFEEGNDIGELQNTLRETDTLMQRVFDIVGTARKEYDETDNIDMRQLVDEIYQTWLMTTPERSARRHFMHAKQIAGFSPNTLANLQNQISTNANELTKLAYAGRVRAGVSAVKDTINDPERPVSEKTMLGDFARELELRAEQELNPPARGALNTFVNALNRFSFYYFLTSAKTALTNFANIPIRVVPRFWREYGYAEGTAMWIKYMKMWDSLGRVKIERTNKRFGDYVDAIMPTVNGSNFVKNNEDLQWAMKAGTERGILMTTADTMVHNERANPLTAKGSITGKLQDLHANVGKVMSFLFTGTENISRQATYYMAFELEMQKQAKENPNMPREQRREIALQKALRIVDDTIGNFADWERPRIAKGEATRAFFLFKMHPILQTKFMTGVFRDVIAAPLRGAARQATGRGKMTEADTAYVAGALKEFSGVLMMGGLLGGLTAMPFYTIMAQALAEGFDQEDDDDVRKLMGIDPRTAYDADIMFRSWIMEHLGTPEKGDVDFADIVLGGVPGAMTDTEIASTLSLDLVNMWYREPIAGDSLESTMTAALIANIAGFSMISQMLKSYEDFENDNTSAALKKLLPAFFRAPATAYYSQKEGVKTREGKTVIPKEDITASDTFRSILGARSARLARWQDYYITQKKNESRIEGEKEDILAELKRKIDSGEIATQGDFNKFLAETVAPFNRTYPDPDLMITMESIERSLRGRMEREARTEQGLLISKKSPEQERRSAEPFRPK